MIGLALEGGGARGAYQVGALKAFKECGIIFDGVTGTSIGSLNAALIAAGDDDLLEKLWLNENMGKILGFFEDEHEINGIVDAIKDKMLPYNTILKNKGLNVENFKNKLDEIINEEKIRKGNMDYGLVTYRIKDKKPLYLFKEDIPDGKITDYILASCFLPVFKPMLLDGDSYYLDGGFYDASPSNMLENKNYETIYIVGLKSIGIKKKKLKKAELIKINPTRSLGGMLNVDKNNIKKNIEMGYMDTLRILKKLDGKKYCFIKHKDFYYKWITRRVKRRTLERIETFFFTKNKKDLVIKSLEYIMTKEKYSYDKIYKPCNEIKKIKKKKCDIIAYKFISELKFF